MFSEHNTRQSTQIFATKAQARQAIMQLHKKMKEVKHSLIPRVVLSTDPLELLTEFHFSDND